MFKENDTLMAYKEDGFEPIVTPLNLNLNDIYRSTWK